MKLLVADATIVTIAVAVIQSSTPHKSMLICSAFLRPRPKYPCPTNSLHELCRPEWTLC